ncbi:MAG: glutamate-5-semialdehyde dehydrogenase [Erysipelotrichaceae bacterium]|nr:glutamate-5-semialdehyde dehydrogenase [Erysipelotrichaceae bacterium]
MISLKEMAVLSKDAEKELALADNETKNRVLISSARLLRENSFFLMEENRKDLDNAVNLSAAFMDRLRLNEKRIEDMASGLEKITSFPDPVNNILEERTLNSGVHLLKKSVPLGVIGIIFESRPNVSADSFGLCLKSGNALILRGGKESILSNMAIVKVLRKALEENNMNPDSVQLVEDTDHKSADEMMKMNGMIDCLIPRGSSRLIQAVVDNASVPVIETGAGVCHTYIDEYANDDMAIRIIDNAKTSRPSVCNALECVIVHEKKLDILSRLEEVLDVHNVEIRADEKSYPYFKKAIHASSEDFGKEYNDYILAVKTVSDLNEAIDHINTYGTKHSECIITDNNDNALRFMNMVDCACVYHNASTRFTDGGEFGLGAEIGISTQKLHARGPLGIKELTSYKYYLEGNGEIR